MTYSLTLREGLGRKLTIKELDDNFLYVLENASGGSGATGPTGPQGFQGPTGAAGSGVGGTFSFDFGTTYSGYSLELRTFGFFDNSFTGTFSVGDLIVGSESGNTGVIDSIFFGDGIFIFSLDSFSGSTFYTPDYYINQTQVGELLGEITEYPDPGQIIVYDIITGTPSAGILSTIVNNTASLISTFSVVSNNILISDSQQRYAWIKGATPGVIGITYSAGVLAGNGVLGGTNPVIASVLSNNFSKDGGFIGVGKIEQPYDESGVFMGSFGPNISSSKLITKSGNFEIHSDEVNNYCASLSQNFNDGIQMTHRSCGCETTLSVDSCCGVFYCKGVRFYLPISGFSCGSSYLKATMCCSDVCMSFDSDTCNTCFGYLAGNVNLGTSNTFIGAQSGQLNVSTCNNTFLGISSGYSNSGNFNTFIGSQAGKSNSSGNNNTFISFCSGFNNNSGASNIFIGVSSGFCNTIGNNNLFIGGSSGYCNNSDNNTFIGSAAGYQNIGGTNNNFLGFKSGYTSTGDNNTFIGHRSGYYTTCHNNVALGYCAGSCNAVCNTIAIGSCAEPIISGDFAIGSSAYPVLVGTTASVNGGSLDSLGLAYMCVIINGTRYKLPLYQ